MYDELLVKPMRDELAHAGFEELKTPADVDRILEAKEGTVLLVFNSVCGCAAGMARPGAMMAVQHGKKPEKLVTVFAGQDTDATQKARSYIAEYPPSSPSMALFKNGELAWFLPRHGIEGHSAEQVSEKLTQAFEAHC